MDRLHSLLVWNFKTIAAKPSAHKRRYMCLPVYTTAIVCDAPCVCLRACFSLCAVLFTTNFSFFFYFNYPHHWRCVGNIVVVLFYSLMSEKSRWHFSSNMNSTQMFAVLCNVLCVYYILRDMYDFSMGSETRWGDAPDLREQERHRQKHCPLNRKWVIETANVVVWLMMMIFFFFFSLFLILLNVYKFVT